MWKWTFTFFLDKEINMFAKTIVVVCAQVFLIQSAFSACTGGFGYGLGGYNCAAVEYGAGCGCGATGVASTGGGLPVSSISPIAPVGITVISENVYEGQLRAGGNLPFLGSVAIEGVLPTGGTGAVSYGCGDGAVAINSEGPIATGITIPGAIFPPNTPSTVATADAIALVPGVAGAGVGYNGLGYGLGGIAGYGLGAGCGHRPVSCNGWSGCGCGIHV